MILFQAWWFWIGFGLILGILEILLPGFILLGLMFESGFSLITIKLFFIGLLLLFTGPTATHALARAAIIRGLDPNKNKKRNNS